MPRELEVGAMLTRFGSQAVFGRVLSVGEMRRIMRAESITRAYQEREHYRDKDGTQNFAEWARNNKAQSRLLNEAMKAAGDDGE